MDPTTYVDVQGIWPRRQDRLRAAPHQHHAALGGRLGDHPLGHLGNEVFFSLDGHRVLRGGDEHLRRRDGQRLRQPLEQPGRPLLAAGHLVGRQPRQMRHLIDELVVDQRPASAEAVDDQSRDLRSAGGVLARDRDERLYC